MLQLSHVNLTQEKDFHPLIRDLSLVVNTGDKLAIIGEEGTGKSSLLKAIARPAELAHYIHTEGEIVNQFQQTAYLPQHLSAEDAQKSVTDFLYADIDYVTFNFNLFYRLAEQFGLDLEQFEHHKQDMASLSGGEKLKVQLLKLLAYEPDLLLLDEPSSDLDLDGVQWLERFIRQSEATILFISHDEAFLETTATAILHLELLKKRQSPRASFFQGNYKDYKQHRRESFERQLQRANKEREEHAKKVVENQRVRQKVEHELRTTNHDVIGRLLAKKMHSLKSQERRFEKETEHFTEIPQDMDAIHLFFSEVHPLPARKILLQWENHVLEMGQSVDLQIAGQDKLVITGKNGIGKTRLLQEITQTLLVRTDISIGYMPQNYEELLPDNATALDFLSEVAEPERARTLLASLRFTREEILHAVRELSGGQKAKLFLAKMVLTKNNVLMLDEPTRHFSPTSQPLIRQILINFPGAIISVSHDRKYIEEVATITYELNRTQLVKTSEKA